VIQKQVQDPLAEQILAGRIKDGQKVKITVKGGALVINGEPVKAAA
jgi:ATP-dependent Clp protease ATP-binding subunit ClpB